jgi:ligand-binding sensor domain-containing protein/two-component sensor histidine kinase
MLCRLTCIIVFFGIMNIATAESAQPFLRKISFLEGLPSQTIYDMFSSQKGFLYLGTNKGLVKFNGAEFTLINVKGKHAKSINNICENEEGRIWCKNFSNQVFYLENDTLRANEKLQSYLAKTDNLREIIMVKNTLWLMTQFEVFTFNTLSEKIESKYTIDNNSKILFVDIFYNKREDVIYLADIDSVYKLVSNKREQVYATDGHQTSLMEHEGEMYVTAKNYENSCFNLTKKTKIQFPKELDNSYFNYLRSTENQLWLCTNKGLLMLNFEDNNKAVLLLQNRRISDVVEDFQGNIWISTLDDGLFLLPNIKLAWHPLFDYYKTQEHHNMLPIVRGPEQTFFLGSSLGHIYWYSVDGEIIKSFDTGFNNEIEFLYFDSVNNRLLHTFGYIDLTNLKMENSIGFGKFVYPDDANNYMICTYALAGLIPTDFNKGVNYNGKNEGFRKEKFSPRNIDLLALRMVRARCAIFSPLFQKYYVAFSDGLWVYDKKGVAKTIFNNGEPIIVNSMKLDSDGKIWLATLYQGLLVLEDDVVVQTISESNGLSHNDCKHLVFADTLVFVVNENGIDRLNRMDNKILNITKDLALNQLEINDLLVIDNQLFFTTNMGLLTLSLNYQSSFHKPLIFASDVKVNDVSFTNLEGLKYYQNNIEIKFEVVNFSSLGQHEIKYRLLGYDTIWRYQSGAIQRINFLSLPSGYYTFQVQAISNETESVIIEISFDIQQPFWLRWWFVAIEITLGGGVLFWVYRLAENRTRARQIIKEKLALSQLTALRSQMNPHFLFNVLNSVQGLIYANKKNDASEYLGKFSDLMRKILEISNKKVISLREEIDMLTTYIELESGRFEEGFEYVINIAPELDAESIKLPTMIVQPFVENAIKHGLMHKKGHKSLTINCAKSEVYPQYVLIAIEDNGVGREAANELNKSFKKHASFATKAIDSRIHLLNQSLTENIIIECVDKKGTNKQPQGTVVNIFIPLHL